MATHYSCKKKLKDKIIIVLKTVFVFQDLKHLIWIACCSSEFGKRLLIISRWSGTKCHVQAQGERQESKIMPFL